MGKITVVNHLDLETYLRAVVKSEMLISAPPEALKAQAVVARTFALKNRNRYMSQYGFGLSADESSQVYEGREGRRSPGDPGRRRHPWPRPLPRQGPRGLLLPLRLRGMDPEMLRRLGEAGIAPTSSPSTAPTAVTYPGFEWSYEISYKKLFAVLLENGYRIGSIRNVEESPRRLRTGAGAEAAPPERRHGQITPSQLRNMLGPRAVRSTFFRLDPQAGEAICPEMAAGTLARSEAQLTDIISSYLKTQDPNAKLRLRGTGSGHGVGLCQSGARRQASIGKSFREILSYYYQGITLTKAY